MYVAELLAEKGTDVISTNMNETVRDAARLLRKMPVGITVVRAADGALAGVVSERDIVKAMVQHGKSAIGMPVSDVMTRDVMTCKMTDTMQTVAIQMTRHGIRHMPVLDHDQILGVVSIRDIAALPDDELSATRSIQSAAAAA
jgi:CBS domain-containing protein